MNSREKQNRTIDNRSPVFYVILNPQNLGNPLPNNQTNITKPLADRMGIKAGDTVTFISKEDGKTYTFQIDAVAASYIEQFIYLPLAEFNQKMGLPENSFIGLFSTKKLDIPDEKLSGFKAMGELPGAMDEFMGQVVSMVVILLSPAWWL